jgi:Zn-dependent M28 family amino/carboxypeptidase
MTRLQRVTLVIAFLPVACGLAAQQARQAPLLAVDANLLLQHIKVLSSDEYSGRLPGTKGEDLSVAYIADQFRKIGLTPGNTDGTYFQNVPLVGMTPDPAMTLTFRKGSTTDSLKYLQDFVAWTRHEAPTAGIENSPLVFVGYGVQAPEFNWDDYKGVDVKGKTVVMLINDPSVADSKDPIRLDPTVFGGDAMTYYGRWTYKYDIGAQKGAAGILIVHETAPAGYPWSVVQGFGGERFDLVSSNGNMDKAQIEGWITLERARKLFAMAGQNFDTLRKRAATREFRPVSLDVTASVNVRNRMRRVDSRNVIGRLDGSDPKLADQCVVYSAHWDHFGAGPAGIYHGAADNASGVAGIIEIARGFARTPVKPKRTLLFIAVTGEEQGLLGSGYYVLHPVIPLTKTLADINVDVLNVHGKTRDVTVVGLGKSDLDDVARRVAGEQRRVVHGDLEPQKGYYYRSDHFEFARQGVPGLYVDWVRNEFVGKPADFGRNVADYYTEHNYHKPSDVIMPDWDLGGAVQDLQLLWRVGYDVAQANKYPEWKPGSEFKAKRDADLHLGTTRPPVSKRLKSEYVARQLILLTDSFPVKAERVGPS